MCNLSAGVLAKGKEIGLAEGMAKGRAEGVEKGRTEERFEMIRNMYYSIHLPVEVIAQAARTTVDEIRKILADMKVEE